MAWIGTAAVALSAVAWVLPLRVVAVSGVGRRPLVWGMDLGNDNIVMAVASRSGVDVVVNDVSGRQTPSALYFAGDHRLLGEHSTGHAGSNPRNLVHHVKSLLEDEGDDRPAVTVDDDRDSEDRSVAGSRPNLQRRSRRAGRGAGGDMSATRAAAGDPSAPLVVEEPHFFCETRRGEGAAGQAGLLAVVQHMGGELEMSASEAIAYLLRHCADVVAREADGGRGRGEGEPSSASSCVVASVPSYFSLRQKRAVLDAASIAGVPMPMVIDEGTAVALAYGILKGGLPSAGAERPLTVAFVDIGHSCTQVTVASFDAAGLKVLGRGCARGGGTAAVEASVYDLVCGMASGQGVTVKGRPRGEFRLAQALTSAMKTLSANTEARLSVDCIDGDKDVAMTLTREEVETACAGVADGVVSACREALRAAGMVADEMADVELLGGGSYIPILRRSVESIFGDRVRRTMSSSESVATGCALAAAQHSSVFKLRPFQVVDALSKDLRLVWRHRARAASGGGESTGEVDVPAGTPIPWSATVPVEVGGPGAGGGGVAGEGKVHVHLMEGADRVASYVIDLSPPEGGGRDGAWSEGKDARLTFSFRVDDGGVPSVQSARLEYDEEVTEFVEVPAAAPREHGGMDNAGSAQGPEQQAEGANESQEGPVGGEGESQGVPKKGVAQDGSGGQETVLEDEDDDDAKEENGGDGGDGGEGKRAAGDDEEIYEAPESKDDGDDDDDNDDDNDSGGEGSSSASGNEEERRNEGGGAVKVPRVVTRVRSRAVRLEQTYTGMLEGEALEEARARELALRAQDEAVRLAGEARNALENLVYTTRSSLEPGDGDLSPFVKPNVAAAVLSALEETEDWLYVPDGTPDKLAFEQRATALREQLSEARSRRQARLSLSAALEEAEVSALQGSAQLEEARESLSGSQRRHADNELASIQKFVSETRKKLESSVQTGDYGSLLGRLPAQEGDVRKKVDHLSKVLEFTRKEHC